MARVQFSAALNSIQGSIGGSTFQKNKQGFTMKNKQVINRSTSFLQNSARGYISELLKLWQSMSAAQRQAWQLYTAYNPSYCKNNGNVTLSGYQLFIKYNSIRLHAGFEPMIDVVYAIPKLYQPELIFNTLLGELYVAFDIVDDPSLWSGLIRLSAPRSRAYPVSASCYKVVRIDPADLPFCNITDNYLASFGRLPLSGQYLSYIVTIFNLDTPASQAPYKSITIVN